MGYWTNLITSIRGSLAGPIPFGGTLITPTDEDGFATGTIFQIKGASFAVADLETMADIPYEILWIGMSVTVIEHIRPNGAIFPRTKYALYSLPPLNTRVSEVTDYDINNYWSLDTPNTRSEGTYEQQYAPNVNNTRPLFLPTEISREAYNAGYANDDDYNGGNPGDIIWSEIYDPSIHLWTRQRIGGSIDWGIPQSLQNSNYESGQFIDVRFKYVTKGDPAPAKPPTLTPTGELNNEPTGWTNTPGDNFDTEILTKDLYRSQVIKNPFGKIKGDWTLPYLVSNDPQLVRYGNTPSSTDFFNNVIWRGYFTPGLDLFMATRPDSGSSNWTITKIDGESGEYPDFVFKLLPIGASTQDIIDATPTFPVPINSAAPNDWKDSPPSKTDTTMVVMSQCVKNFDGSFKSGKSWSLPVRFDGLDTIQAVIEDSPGDTFYNTRVSGVITPSVTSIDLVAKLYKGPDELTTGINGYRWYRGATEITFSGETRYATNLGTELNPYHRISVDGKTLTITPGGVTNSQEYTVGITSDTRASDYEDNILIKDATDDGNAFLVDIVPESGTTFKNQTGLYKFDAQFIQGGVVDNTGITFTWSIESSLGSALTNALRNAGGASIGDTEVAAGTVYVQGSDIDQYAVLILTATIGEIVRTTRVTLTDVSDAAALEILFWGTGDADPGNPTDFTPRTLTKQEVLDLNINYTEDSTGAWYSIWKVNGSWGGEIKLRGEASRPAGGIPVSIYKNVVWASSSDDPATPSVPGSGSIIPSGWTLTPTAKSSGEQTFITSGFFSLRTDVDADPTVLTRANYNVQTAYGAVIRISGIDGDTPAPVEDGENGWTPIIALVSSGGGEYHKIVDWVGGTGTKPAANTSASYIGPLGLTTIGAATNLKGENGVDYDATYNYYDPNGTISASTWSAFNSATQVQIVTASVKNKSSSIKRYWIRGLVHLREDGGEAENHIALTLYESSTLRDRDLVQRLSSGTADYSTLRVSYIFSLPPGATKYFSLRLQQITGGGSLRTPGLLEIQST